MGSMLITIRFICSSFSEPHWNNNKEPAEPNYLHETQDQLYETSATGIMGLLDELVKSRNKFYV
jgi:hypothetical protein